MSPGNVFSGSYIARLTVAAGVALLLLSLIASGCGGMSRQEYINAVWEVHKSAGDRLSALFQGFNERTDMVDVKSTALHSLELAQEMERIFSDSLDQLEDITAPGELADLHSRLLALYRDGLALSEDFIAAYDHLYEISLVLDTFTKQGIATLDLDIENAPQSQLIPAMDSDIRNLKELAQQLEGYSAEGPMQSFDTFLKNLFSQLADTLSRHRDAILKDQPEARTQLASELTALVSTLNQEMQSGIPGLGDLAERLAELKSTFTQLKEEINGL
jgi:hypothetical protein